MAPAPVSGSKNWQGECKNLWRVAGPVILASVFQFLIAFVTAAFVGHIGKVELAAVSIVNGVIEGLAFGLLVTSAHGMSLPYTCGDVIRSAL
jgi:MATE family multidrug resistance protein